MPIKIPDSLPALSVLANENIFVMSQGRAQSQDIRPMQLAIVNLMPNKIETEIQLLRMLSNTPLQVNVDLVRLHLNEPKHTAKAHVDAFYVLFDDIKHKRYDGLIITGAPLAQLEYQQVSYWQKICDVFAWANSHVTSTLYSCWAAHAALYYRFGIERQLRQTKLSGVYRHQTMVANEPLTRGFDEYFLVPHSRFGQLPLDTYKQVEQLAILAHSAQAGVYLAATKDKKHVFVTGHPEYDATTLNDEYQRDLASGVSPHCPENYYPDDDPINTPVNSWRSHGSLLFTNWLNYYVYQITPYQLQHGNTQTVKR
ncbi:homoserine O-succinyltransferase [Thalassotalea ponticola]|uniref:homoserine O-succinyltransferase n=1 Tax=Thalassotalea ponticola TaxID=1523392 RepID=UPI0025B41F58|nr:homoserine O-succinyltransferase [Thalassotalea ponticola]MDN3652143.1 homoserine O-succinyltransferase [Thalassotalea ponticola]